jgi:hypothetical protein
MDQQREIEQIAYELYLERGGRPGDPVADWLTAERIYIERQTQASLVEAVVEVSPKKATRKKADTAKTAAPKAEQTVKAPTTRAKKATKKAE